jgi:hypothetical protein
MAAPALTLLALLLAAAMLTAPAAAHAAPTGRVLAQAVSRPVAYAAPKSSGAVQGGSAYAKAAAPPKKKVRAAQQWRASVAPRGVASPIQHDP